MTLFRRRLSAVSGSLASLMLLTACLGNPPDRTGAGTGSSVSTTVVKADAGLETRTISLGFVPILESAPLVMGVEKGFFARHGLEVKLSKQASWSAAQIGRAHV